MSDAADPRRRRLRLAFVTTGLGAGGAETMLFQLLRHIDRERFDPYVISLTTKGQLGPSIEALRLPVVALGMQPGLPNPVKVLSLIRHFRALGVDLVQTWMYHADLIGSVAARLAGMRHVVWGLHHSNLDKRLNKRSTLMVMKACAALSPWLPTQILSCSARAKAVHAAAGYQAGKIRIIPNGFDLQRFQPDPSARNSVRAELGLASEAMLVGLIARYDSHKNHLGFIHAAAMVKAELPDVHFVLAGTGIDGSNSDLLRAIRAHNLERSMHLLGRRDDIPRLMASLDVLASPSVGEAFPMVLGEAMACGVPCIVTNAGDSEEIVGDSGRVVVVGDMHGLARHIVDVLRLQPNERLALGRRARARVEVHYEIGHVTKLYEAFYEGLMNA